MSLSGISKKDVEVKKRRIRMIIAATGHRLGKLGGYGQEIQDRLEKLAMAGLKKYGATKVISGMAIGWDFAIAKAALKLELPLIAAVPFKGQECRWNAQTQLAYRELLEKACEVIVVSEGGFSGAAMQKRNEYMVDRCEMLLALFSGEAGGTANCLEYAKKQKTRTIDLWNSWQRFG
jgi:uncharacterized phage-like protein YoqJ